MSPLLRGRLREEAQAALDACDAALAALDAGGADLGPARRLRERAGEALRKDPRGAIEAAEKAKATAKLLDRLHGAAARGIARLRIERDRMTKLGMDPTDVESLIQEASSWMGKSVERDGDPDFPAYGKAAEVALEGLRLAKTRIPRYRAAAAAIADAERAIRETVAANRSVTPEAFKFFVLKPATDMLDAAYARLRGNEFDDATELARSTIEDATSVRETCLRVTALYESAAEGVNALKEEGAAVAEAEDLLALSRSALERGKFEDAAGVATQTAARLEAIRGTYRDLVLRERTAAEALVEVRQWGFDVRDPRAILEDARALRGAGRYEEAARRFDEARGAAYGLRETHRSAAARIDDARRSVATVRAANPESAAQATGLLERAEGFLEEGRYRECEENLQLASLLLAVPETQTPARTGRAGVLELLDAGAPGPECPTCGGPLAPDGTCPDCADGSRPGATAEETNLVRRAVDEAREVLKEIEEREESGAERGEPETQSCAMCGGSLEGEDVLCLRCQSIVKGRAA